MNASVHTEASNQPIAVYTELFSSNPPQSMDKPTEQPEMSCGITVSVIQTVIFKLLKQLQSSIPESENSDHSDVITETSDSDTELSVPVKCYFKHLSVLNVLKSQSKVSFSDSSGNKNNCYPIISITRGNALGGILLPDIVKLFL